jgi:DNA-binding MarR family transcriptional regulator
MADGHDLAMRLGIAYLALHRRTNAALAPLGLTADQFVLLTSLAECEGVTQKELVGRTGSDPNTMSAMLARLEAKGLIERKPHADDGRARSVSLTRRGRQLQRTLWETSASLRAELESRLPPDVLDALVAGLDRVALAMNPLDCPEGGPLREKGGRRPRASNL